MENCGGLLKTRWIGVGFKTALALALFLFVPKAGGAAPPRPPGNLSVTTEILDLDSGNAVCTISSDGGGPYENNVEGVSSILTGNTCNGLTWGDWRFDSTASSRAVTESFFPDDAVLEGEPGAQQPYVAAQPPYWNSALQLAWMNVQCTCTGKSMYTMGAGTQITCPLLNSWKDAAGNTWGISPAHSWNQFPETTDALITCNSAVGGHCVDWFIDPEGGAGTEAVGRVVEKVACKRCAGTPNGGDFYMRFRIHVSLP